MPNGILEYVIKYIFGSSLLLVAALYVDNWIANTVFERNDFLRAIVDNSIHFTAGMLTWLLIVSAENTISIHHLKEMILCGCMSSIIDIDHFIKAKSLYLKDALSLKQRPPFHCTSLMMLVNVLLFLIGKAIGYISVTRISWMMTIAIITHHLRDARRRGLWLWPFGSTGPLSTSLYVAASLSLPVLSSILLYKFEWKYFNKHPFVEIV